MSTTQPSALATAAAHFVSTWASTATAEDAAPALSCVEVDALADLFCAAGVPDAANEWIAEHTETESECEGHAMRP